MSDTDLACRLQIAWAVELSYGSVSAASIQPSRPLSPTLTAFSIAVSTIPRPQQIAARSRLDSRSVVGNTGSAVRRLEKR